MSKKTKNTCKIEDTQKNTKFTEQPSKNRALDLYLQSLIPISSAKCVYKGNFDKNFSTPNTREHISRITFYYKMAIMMTRSKVIQIICKEKRKDCMYI